MPEEIKGNARRKPPAPSVNHSDIDDWFRRQMPHLQPIVQALDESIRATIPGLHYAVKWKRPYYGLPERVDRGGEPHAGLDLTVIAPDRRFHHRTLGDCST